MEIRGYFSNDLTFENIKGSDKYLGKGSFIFKEPVSIEEIHEIKKNIFCTCALGIEEKQSMEKEIEEIRNKIEKFMEKYNCSVKIDTTSYGYTVNGKLANSRVRIQINS